MFEALLQKLSRALNKAKIEYMIIGGQAVLFFGEPRLTKDIDITLAIDTDELQSLLKLARSLKLRILVDDPENFALKTKVLPVIHDASGIRVDFIFSSSKFERIAISRVIKVRAGKTFLSYISLDDLIILKTIAGRPRDLDDIKAIMLKNRNYNKLYIEKWLRSFDRALDMASLSAFKAIVKELK